ncbi:aminoacyl-tRNA hydrolase [Leucobacter triazinivorans]|uniref:Peptidyl-tRNA hydrolase n=1 Tax=Leucobacter triazinivorans TaxID=1784719 RepID=A0A4P6KEY8_9MICO|nr:aminoacyl-tRNA hydrolase [Leucobacter triazinivorans]QBE47984.1 aminoacyl-tRNA hydrolase [Leucobacter triazinivorans]
MFWRKRRRRSTEEHVSGDSWLIVGLGNPGAKYEATRHNVGQMALDVLAERLGASFSSHRTGSRIADGRLRPGGPKLILAKSNGYMNTSGGPVSSLSKYFDVPPNRIVVIHDELDLPFDSVKLKQGGGHGGHNGLRDIAKALGTPDFLRVRVGIGRPPGQQDPADYVLRPFATAERGALPVLLEDAADAAESIVDEGLLAAQQRFHGRAAK